MFEASAPTHDDVLAVLADLGHHVGIGLEAILDPRPSSRPLALRAAWDLFHARRGHEARTMPLLSQWLRHGRANEDATATARLAAALIRLLRDAGRHVDGVAGWMPQDADLRAVDLRGEDLRGVVLRGARLDDATLHGADLEGAVLSRARLDRTDLGATRLWDARLDDATGTDTILEHVDAHRCDFRRSRFTRPRMCLSTFTACRWTGAVLLDAEVGPTLVVDSDPPERAPRPPRPRWMVRPVSWTAALPQDVSWSPDGRTFIMNPSYSSVLLVDATTGDVRRTLEQPDRSIGSVWPSPNGEAIATDGTFGRSVRVWSIASGELRLELGAHDDIVTGVAWSPDGGRIATAGSSGVHVWSGRDGALQCVLPNEDYVSALWFPRGDRLVTAKWTEMMRLWDLSRGEVLCDLSTAAADGSPAWSRDGERLAAVGSDGVLRIWDASSGELRLSAPGFAPRSTVAWSPDDDRLAVIGEGEPPDARLQIVDARDASPQVLMSAPTGSPWMLDLVWSPRGDRLVTVDGQFERFVSLWNANDGSRCASPPTRGFPDRVHCLWSPDGTVLGVMSLDQPGLELLDADDGQPLSTLVDGWPAVSSATWLSDGQRMLTHHGDGTTRWWDLRRGTLLRTLTLPRAADRRAWPSSDGRWIACLDDEGGRIYDLEHGVLRAVFPLPTVSPPPKARNEHLAWSPDGRRLACRAESWLGIWDVEADAWLEPWAHTRTKDARYGSPIAWSPDGRRLAVGHGRDATVIDVDTGAVALELTGIEGPLKDLAWSPDGTRLAGAVHGNVSPIWSTRDGTITCVLDHGREMCDIAVSVSWAPHGRALATASISGTVWTWSADDGRCTLTLRVGGSRWWQVAWSPDGTRLATNGPDVQLWDAATGALVAQLHADGDAWLVSVAGGGLRRGPQRPRAMLAVAQPHGHAYLPAAGILERPTPTLVEATLAGRSPGTLDDALGWPTQPAWEGGVQRLTWVDEPDGVGES